MIQEGFRDVARSIPRCNFEGTRERGLESSTRRNDRLDLKRGLGNCRVLHYCSMCCALYLISALFSRSAYLLWFLHVLEETAISYKMLPTLTYPEVAANHAYDALSCLK